jgi:beta-N-acetylhexosaminidase
VDPREAGLSAGIRRITRLVVVWLIVAGCLISAPPGVHGSAHALSASRTGTVPLRSLIGRLVFTGFSGTGMTPNTRHLIRTVGVGGLVIKAYNVTTRSQLRALSEKIRLVAGHRRILVGVTQEAGVVDHLNGIFPVLPSPQELASRRPWASRKTGCLLGKQLASVRIDVDMAPVLDVLDRSDAYIGDRSYGRDPDEVASHGAAFIRGIEQAGIFPIAKHFPGLGYVTTDPHMDLPVDPRGLARLQQRDLVPYEAAFDVGVPAVMTAHVLYERIDPGRPASLSRTIGTGLLRERLGFDGLVITDSLGMGGLSGPVGSRAVRAISAGADMVLLTDPQVVGDVVAALRHALTTGRISRARVEDALQHVSAATQRVVELRHDRSPCPS